MQPWERATREFLRAWQRRPAFRGALACGSFVTGHPGPRSDVDLVIVLASGTRWRERGNRFADGLMVEYFANSPKQYRAYMKGEQASGARNTATMFVTGKILVDERGDVAKLVAEAKRWRRKALPRMSRADRENALYTIWSQVDDLQDAVMRGAADVPFQYYHAVWFVYDCYARFLRQPVQQADRILTSYARGGHPEKYLLDPFPDPDFPPMLARAIRERDPDRMLRRLERLADHVYEQMGGFEIDGWKLRTPSA